MSTINIKFAPISVTGLILRGYGMDNATDNRADYIDGPTFESEVSGEEAAEEAFDLSNNPARQDERETRYGNGRSVSVGDIVVVDGTHEYLCASLGWILLEVA
jgi:hypothetical protein